MVAINFKDATRRLTDDLDAKGHFYAVCDHGMGHTVPFDSVASAWQFLQDHPFGTNPSPYAEGLPANFPSYCSL